jgi:DNA-directed RNA polymerase subunit RPC12/RpoP
LDNKCPSCNAPLKYNPVYKKWKCEYCDSEFTLEDLKKYDNASSEKNNQSKDGDDVIYDSYRCPDCGAEIVADENTSATFCVYCGNTAIIKSKLSGKFAPSKIIPFKTTKEDAIETFKSLKKGRPLLPKEFVSQKNIDKITGIYIPFWLFSAVMDGEVKAMGDKITTWSSGNTHYTKTDIYELTREGSVSFSKVPVDGSKKFDDAIMNTIEPFDYNELVDYNHAYLSGFLAEKYDVLSDEALEIAFKRAEASTINTLKNDIKGYTTVSIKNNSINKENQKNEYALLPVWLLNVKYKNKLHTFAMNGQTGKLIGDIPVDPVKAIIWWIVIFGGVMIIFVVLYLIGVIG